MKVLVLTSGRGTHPGLLATWREALGLVPEDELSVLSWHPPAARLPAEVHVLGPGDSLPGRVITKATRGRGISTRFGLAAATSRRVRALFRGMDLAVPMDTGSHKAAWLLARREAGPDVVVSPDAAARRLAARRGSAH